MQRMIAEINYHTITYCRRPTLQLCFVANSLGLTVIDVSVPTTPVIIGSLDTPGKSQGIDVSGVFAYVADQALGVRIIDVTDPTAPLFVGLVNTPGVGVDVVHFGSHVYVADLASGLLVLEQQCAP